MTPHVRCLIAPRVLHILIKILLLFNHLYVSPQPVQCIHLPPFNFFGLGGGLYNILIFVVVIMGGSLFWLFKPGLFLLRIVSLLPGLVFQYNL